ncbi:alpha/beta hydrolase [Sphingomonas sp.]|uniref:alpha/beta fold hydrolase n=1 Tax=Sphingomonas sp. TaxID=28214 RepID=UPI002C434E47|nr:alpha/beta hydrolase [Sphingomonas sp.]HWK35133.1 alpha/beta hydrolase [Sphingomonas sp.]
MTPASKARLIAAVALPALLLNLSPGHARAAAPAPATVAAAPVQMEHISVSVTGAGPDVILIPGLSSPRAVWDGVVPALAKTHRVHVVQINGFGGDDPRANTAPGILDGTVADLDTYVARAGLKAPAVVGHSLGGLVGLMLARAHPGDVSRLMVVDSLPYIGDLFLRGATVAMVEPQAKAMREQILASYGKPADAVGAERTANGLAATPEARAKVKAWAMAADPRVTAQALYEDMTTDLRPDIAAIAAPITAIYPAPGDALYRDVYAKAKHATFVPITDTAHFVMLDQPGAFAGALTAFLAAK